MDHMGTGLINEQGLHKIFEKSNVVISCAEVHKIISEVDY